MDKQLNQEEIDESLTNDYLNNNHILINKPLNNLIKKLDTLDILQNYLDWNCHNAYKINNQSLLFTISINQRILEDEGYDSAIDNQLLLWLELKKSIGNYYLTKFDFLNRLYHFLFNKDAFKLSNYNVIGQKSESKDIKAILAILDTETKLEIEIKASSIFIKTTKRAKIEDVKKLERLTTKLKIYLKA